MAKETGLGANFYLAGWDLSGDTGSLSTISKSLVPTPVTGINRSAVERLAGQLDGKIGWSSYFNPTNAHLALSPRPRTDQMGSYWHRPALGMPVASCVAKQLNYDPTRDATGGLTLAVELQANAWWLDWGLGVTPGKRTDVAATNGTSVDFGAGFAFGLQAYLHVFAFTGTSCTITLQQSSDNGVGDPFSAVPNGAFAAVTAGPKWERLATLRTESIERYLRVVTTGVFTSITFAVAVTVNQSGLII